MNRRDALKAGMSAVGMAMLPKCGPDVWIDGQDPLDKILGLDHFIGENADTLPDGTGMRIWLVAALKQNNRTRESETARAEDWA